MTHKKLLQRLKHVKGVHTSGGFTGLEEKGQSQAGRNIQRATEPQPNMHMTKLYHERGKEMHREKLAEQRSMPKPNLPKSEELDKAKNAKEQKEKIFGTKAQPGANSDMRAKHLAAIKEFFQKRYNVPVRETPGKLNAQGKLIDKPDWRTGNLEYQDNPEAAVHEGGHFEQMPPGTTMQEHQAQMDRNFGITNRDYGYLSGKQTQFEIQPMAAENLLRRRMGLPATTVSVKGQDAKGKELPPRMARDTHTPAAVRVKDHKGIVKDLIRQSRLLSPENREQTDMIDRGELIHEPQVGFVPGSSPDSRINQRAREAAKDPSRKDAKTLMRSDMSKSTGLPGEFEPHYAKDLTHEERQASIAAIDRGLKAHQAKLASVKSPDEKTDIITQVHSGSMTHKLTASEDKSEPVILNRGTRSTPVTNGAPSTVRGHMEHDSTKVLGNLMSKLNKLKRS
jgi:hypothetical protein